jgi:hypothetical protein
MMRTLNDVNADQNLRLFAAVLSWPLFSTTSLNA